ncbi:hypothetical protein QN277_018156 [Acacia crassicarpa]|uniref:Uncharacterized protein n=1 Tax=Acacia crassicarpa TaxID=499986 RepID=A0AAE1JTY1_9FABA|nr:hypothetical protein QN277_018156 [Acacia crassicarpa]
MVLSKTSSQTDVSVHSTFASRYVRASLPRFVLAVLSSIYLLYSIVDFADLILLLILMMAGLIRIAGSRCRRSRFRRRLRFKS